MADGQRAWQVVVGRRLTLNRFLWIAQQALLDACTQATNRAGVGNYKSDPPQLIMKATDKAFKGKIPGLIPVFFFFHGGSALM